MKCLDIKQIGQNTEYKSETHPGSIERDHELARLEGVDDLFDQLHVVVHQPVCLEADVAEGNLRSDVYSGVVSQTSRAVGLSTDM